MLAIVVLCSLLSATTRAASVVISRQVWASDQRKKTANNDVSDEWQFVDPAGSSHDDDELEVSDSRPRDPVDYGTGNVGEKQPQQFFDGRQQPSKRRQHMFVGKRPVDIKRYQLEADTSDRLGDEGDESQEKRGRMFVGKRWSSLDNDDGNQDDDNVTAFEKIVVQPSYGRRASSTSQKRVRMFVGKKKAPFFVGRR